MYNAGTIVCWYYIYKKKKSYTKYNIIYFTIIYTTHAPFLNILPEIVYLNGIEFLCGISFYINLEYILEYLFYKLKSSSYCYQSNMK